MGLAHARCGRRFAVLEWQHEGYGKLAICMWCLADALKHLGYDVIVEKVPGRWRPTRSAWRILPSRKRRKSARKRPS
jgi:hypothetical protein